SAKPKLEYSADLWQNQLHDFINEVIGQKTILAGNSLGGYACLCVASQHYDSVAGVVLLNSAGPFSQVENKIQPDPNPLKKLLENAVKWCFKKRLVQSLLFEYTRQKWVIRQTLEKVYLDKNAVTDQLVAEIQRPAYDPGALDVFISVFSTPQGEKVDVLLKQLNCPLLLLWGEADPWMKARERSLKFHEYYPELTEYFLIAGHCPHDEIPEQVNLHLRNWVMSLN
ncbi:MAG: alpha/beta fold hydrolase, partial [Dolichospermum sp.]